MDKQSKTNCQICKAKYTVFVTEHVCKRCGRSCCKDCVPNKKMIYKVNMKAEEHRLCQICYPQSEQISSYIKNNSLSFGNMSQVGREWLQIISADMPPQKNANSSKNSLPVQDVPQIWPQMTDSFRQFTGIVLNKNFNIQSVLQQVLNSNKDESIDKNNINPFNLLLIYICSHCHEVGSGKVLQYILPILSSFSIERVINKIKLIEEIQNKSLNNYAKNNWVNFAYSFGLNIFKVDIVGHLLFETLLGGSIESLQNAFAFMLSDNKNIILNSNYDEVKVKVLMGRNISIKNVEKGIKIVRKLIMKQDKMKASKKTQKEEQKKEESKEQKLQEKQKIVQKVKVEEEQKIENYDKVTQKIDLAQKYLNQIQKSPNKQPTLEEMENMDQFLDQIIAQNTAQLQEIDKFDHLLDNIMKEINHTEK